MMASSINLCSCPIQQTLDHTTCPVCLLKFNNNSRLAHGLNQVHNVICQKCLLQLHPSQFKESLINLPLLVFLGFSSDDMNVQDHHHEFDLMKREPACSSTIDHLINLARLTKSANVSRAILKKVSMILIWLSPTTQGKLIKQSKSLGNRILLELISQNQVSNYRAQQQLWSAIRSKACIFMGPAFQDEAIKLILLALEDGSALSRKVLIMFVVQRLLPQFAQASKTSIGHVIQLLYRSSCFQFIKQEQDTSNLMTLKQEFRNYEAIRREHDTQIMKIGLEAGLHFSPDQWSHILYGDHLHKSQMQSILDKLTEPQTFKQLTTEFLVMIQRLQDESQSKLLLGVHPYFEQLASIDVNTVEETWENLETITSLLNKVLQVLIEQKLMLDKTQKEKRRRKP